MQHHRKNITVAFVLLSIIAGMTGLAFAASPLYTMFCKVTGYGGTTQTAAAAPAAVVTDRVITVRLNGDVNRHLPWTFGPQEKEVRVKVGQQAMVHYRAKNTSSRAITGTAVDNVTPNKAGIYLKKIQCFCFKKQTLQPGEEADLPVVFFIDPSVMTSETMQDVDTITLSYTFFEAKK